jgi:hypothetical protein
MYILFVEMMHEFCDKSYRLVHIFKYNHNLDAIATTYMVLSHI